MSGWRALLVFYFSARGSGPMRRRRERCTASAISLFRLARQSTAEILDRLTPTEWVREGTHTEAGPYSVEAWLKTYSDHPESSLNVGVQQLENYAFLIVDKVVATYEHVWAVLEEGSQGVQQVGILDRVFRAFGHLVILFRVVDRAGL